VQRDVCEHALKRPV